jgi:hypothetical protein
MAREDGRSYFLLGNRIQMGAASIAVGGGITNDAVASTGWQQLLGLVVAGFMVLFGIRAARAGIVVDRDQVVVHNILRSHRVPLAEIVSVDIGGRWYLMGIRTLCIHTAAGRTIASINMSPGWRSGPLANVQRCVEALNAHLRPVGGGAH